MTNVAFLLVFLSGGTGLVYQVTWQKYLSTLLGSHASATAAILALFFLFLSAGYMFFGRFASKLMKNQLGLYGVIELLIGLYALYSPGIFVKIFDFYIHSQTSGLGAWSGLLPALLLGGSFIALPTFLMGGTIPVLTQALSANYELSTRTHALIYGLNTLGAMVGCLLTGFLLLENLGLDGTLLFAGNLNILIAIAAFTIIGLTKKDFCGPAESIEDSGKMKAQMAVALLLISFCSGYYTFAIEKLVIRMAGLALGSTTYTYTIVVSAFIFAIGIGSLILSSNKRFENPKYFGFVQLGSLVSVILLYQTIPHWPMLFHRVRNIFQTHVVNFDIYWFTVLIVFLLILIIPIGLIGANLPLLFGILQSKKMALSKTVGRLYAVNCIGSSIGAALGGYWIFHFLNARQAFVSTIFVIGFTTVISTWVIFSGRSRILFLSMTLALLIISFLLPNWPDQNFSPGTFLATGMPPTQSLTDFKSNRLRQSGEILFSRFDPNTFATVHEYKDKDKNRALFVNGKPDAHTGGDNTARAMAALTPMGIAPHDLKNVFIIGLGAGLSTAILSQLSEVEKIHVAEISEGVVQSLPYFEKFNYGLKDRMHKVQIQVGDAYKVLLDQGLFDLIVCEPSNPWVSGIEKLYSKEFYQVGFSHLQDQGLYVQWFPLGGVSADVFLAIVNTFQSVFPYSTIFSAHGGALTLVGAKSAFQVDLKKSTLRFKQAEEIFKKYSINTPQSALLNQILSPFMVKASVNKVDDINSLFAPMLEYKSGRAFFGGINYDLTEVLTNKLPLPVPESVEGQEFFVDPFLKSLPKEALTDAFSVLKGSMQVQWVRLAKMAYIHFAKEKVFASEIKKFQDFAFLLGLSQQLQKPFEGGDKLQRLEVLLSQFRLLLAAQEKPKLIRIIPFIENSCLEPSCYHEKRTATAALAKPEIANQIAILPLFQPSHAEVSRVSNEWDEIKRIYRKIEGF